MVFIFPATLYLYVSIYWHRFLHPPNTLNLDPATASGPPQRLTLPITANQLPYFLAGALSIKIQIIQLYFQLNPLFVAANPLDTLKFYVHPRGTAPRSASDDETFLVRFSQWKNGTIRASSRVFNKEPGTWLVTAGLNDLDTRVDPAEFVQAWAVVYYTATWSA